uniref:Uncharacterized protein n=1 Tax=Fagus sylvatica TaxID=28930 RepID=A0A2N9H7B5_FAGSY
MRLMRGSSINGAWGPSRTGQRKQRALRMAQRLKVNRSPPPAGLATPRSRIASSLSRFLSRIEGPVLWQSSGRARRRGCYRFRR